MSFPFLRLQVVGNSMSPTLKPGQFVISFNWYPFRRLKTTDLIVVNVSGRIMVKRVKKIDHQWAFVLGDNLKGSSDSRQFGWINKNKVLGKVIYVYF